MTTAEGKRDEIKIYDCYVEHRGHEATLAEIQPKGLGDTPAALYECYYNNDTNDSTELLMLLGTDTGRLMEQSASLSFC